MDDSSPFKNNERDISPEEVMINWGRFEKGHQDLVVGCSDFFDEELSSPMSLG